MGTKLDTFRTCAKIVGVVDLIICVLKIIGAFIEIFTTGLWTSGKHNVAGIIVGIAIVLSLYLFQTFLAYRLIVVTNTDYEPEISLSVSFLWFYMAIGGMIFHLICILSTLNVADYWSPILGGVLVYTPALFIVFRYTQEIKLVHGSDASSANPSLILRHLFYKSK